VMRWLIPLSMLATGVGVGMVGLVSSYPATCAAIVLSGIGVAAYHPEGARLARSVTGGDHVGMSWFSLGGNVGFALAPVIAAPVLAAGGLPAARLLVLPALLGMLLTLPMLRRADAVTGGPRTARGGCDNWPAFRMLSAVIVLRSVAYTGTSTFLALFVQQRVGHSATVGAVALFVLYTGGAIGTVLGGRLAVRRGRAAHAAGRLPGGRAGDGRRGRGARARRAGVYRSGGAGAVRAVLTAHHPGTGLPAEPDRHRQRCHPRAGGQRRWPVRPGTGCPRRGHLAALHPGLPGRAAGAGRVAGPTAA
jgi:hypothetical protein